jgi:hypothetical protein
MNFIALDNIILNNISDQQNVIITASLATIVEKINVCNLSTNNSGIRLFLKQIRSLGTDAPQSAFILSNLLIERNVTKNLIDFIGSSVFLNDGDSLIIFSGGFSEYFDCITDFYELNETVTNGNNRQTKGSN